MVWMVVRFSVNLCETDTLRYHCSARDLRLPLCVQDLRVLRNRKALAIAPQWYQYRRKSHDLLAWLDDIQRSVDQLPDPPEGERVKVTKHEHTIKSSSVSSLCSHIKT